jgi:hypothetical protein
LYLFPPVSIISGVIGEVIIRKKSRKIWNENK